MSLALLLERDRMLSPVHDGIVVVEPRHAEDGVVALER
jgi:hypothetical protein